MHVYIRSKVAARILFSYFYIRPKFTEVDGISCDRKFDIHGRSAEFARVVSLV